MNKVKSVQLNNFQEICESYKLLHFFLSIFSINCIITKGGVPLWHLIRMAIPFVIVESYNLFTLIYKSLYVLNVEIHIARSIQYMDAVQSVYDLIQYFVDMWYVYKYGADICLEYINRYCYMDSLLGMQYYPDIKRSLEKFLCFILSLWFVTSLYDYLVWSLGYGPIVPIFFTGAYIHLLIKSLTCTYLSFNIMYIEFRLRTVGDQVQTLYANSENVRPMIQEVLSSTWFCPYSNNSFNSAIEFVNAKKNVKLFRCYYLLLSEQVKFINRMFGMRILLNTLSLLIDMVSSINLTVRIIVGSQETPVTFYPAIGSLVKVLMCAVLLISIVWRSEKAYEQRNRLMCLINNLLINKKIDESVVEDIKDFYSLIQSRPISFSMGDFVRIDNSFLVSIASAVVTYSIILLQSVN